MSYSDILENKLLDHWLNKTSYTASTTIHAALSTTSPSDDGTGVTEPADGYTRVSTPAANWTTAADGALSNSAAITFPTATGSWGTIAYFLLYDVSSGGNMLAFGTLTTGRVIDEGETAEFAIGAFDITLT